MDRHCHEYKLCWCPIEIPPNKLIIDGNINYLNELPNTESIIKADGFIDCVSAASIIAKVARDDYMEQINHEIPGYGFSSNVGYGTKLHVQGLENLGVTKIHRTNYKPIIKFINNKTKSCNV